MQPGSKPLVVALNPPTYLIRMFAVVVIPVAVTAVFAVRLMPFATPVKITQRF